MRSRAALLLSVVLGIIAVVMLMTWARSREGELLELAETRDVLVASRDILPNTIIDEQLVLKKRVPTAYVQPQSLTDVNEVRGRVAAVPIPSGAQILGTYLEEGGRMALAYEVPRGRRAVTVAVDEVTGVAGLARPGNFVDILGTFQFGRPTGFQGGQMVYADEKTETRLLLQNIQVVAVQREHRRGGPPPRRYTTEAEAQQQAKQQAEQEQLAQRSERTVSTVTVLASPEQSQQLVLAQELGTLTLILRSNLDAGQVVDLGSLDALGLLKVPIPVKPKARPAWREFRGSMPF
jgi:pilus assembly protein CpaB